MPALVVEKVARALNDDRKSVNGSNVLVLGVAYKKNIDDMRESPALDVIKLLEGRGAKVSFHDPHVPTFREDGHTFTGVELTDAVLRATDAVVIVTDHDDVNYQRVCDLAPVVVDARNATKGLKSKSGRIVPLSANAA